MKKIHLSLEKIVGKGYYDFWASRHRYLVVKGSRGSKKSKTSALRMIVNMMSHPQANSLVIRRYERTLRNSCYSDLVWAISRLNVSEYWDQKVSPLELTYKPTGQKILFRGLDDAQKITSISVPVGVLCWVWIDEAFQLQSEEEFNKLDLSIRGRIPDDLWKQVVLTLNPWSEKWWGKKRFFDSNDPDVLAITTTYECNEWLDDDDKRIFENMRVNEPKRFKVEGLGEWGVSTGSIFENIETQSLSDSELLKDSNNKPFHGLDFGFTDPTAYVGGYVNESQKTIFITRCFMRAGLTNDEIATKLKAIGLKNEVIYCDSAEPKSIEEMRRLGINARPSSKGSDSVRFGIQLIQQYKIVIDIDVPHVFNELSNYSWATDRNGEQTDTPDHEFSHVPDAMRYGVTELLSNKNFSWQRIFK